MAQKPVLRGEVSARVRVIRVRQFARVVRDERGGMGRCGGARRPDEWVLVYHVTGNPTPTQKDRAPFCAACFLMHFLVALAACAAVSQPSLVLQVTQRPTRLRRARRRPTRHAAVPRAGILQGLA